LWDGWCEKLSKERHAGARDEKDRMGHELVISRESRTRVPAVTVRVKLFHCREGNRFREPAGLYFKDFTGIHAIMTARGKARPSRKGTGSIGYSLTTEKMLSANRRLSNIFLQ